MKKLIIILAICLMASTAFAAKATWTWTAENPDGFYIYFGEDTDQNTIIGRLNIPSGATREFNMLDGWFMPGKVYWFEMKAYNGAGESLPSNRPTYSVETIPYVPPGEIVPNENPIPEPPVAPPGLMLESATYKFIPVP